MTKNPSTPSAIAAAPAGMSLRASLFRTFAQKPSGSSDSRDVPLPPLSGNGDGVQEGYRFERRGMDLSGRPRMLMCFGPGRSGKSLLLRWMVERAVDRHGKGISTEPLPALATMDAERATLRQYFGEAVMQPTSLNAAASWFDMLLGHVLREPVNTVVDFPADATLNWLFREIPGSEWIEMLEQAGITPVVLYMLSPRVADLTLALSHRDRGFVPPARAFVLNGGLVHDGVNEFDIIRSQSSYQREIADGAVEVLMPRLFCASAIEQKAPLGLFETQTDADTYLVDQRRARVWLRTMEERFDLIRSWLP